MIYLVYAHPYPRRSRANRVLFDAVRDLDGVAPRVLYDDYADFFIDVEAEQAALERAHTIVWQHPLYWYSVPPLLKLWFDKVLAFGWAFGPGGDALRGKRVLWVATTGGDDEAYGPDGMHAHAFPTYEPPIRQTALFCGMHWLAPIVLHAAHRVPDAELAAQAAQYRERVKQLESEPPIESPPRSRTGPWSGSVQS